MKNFIAVLLATLSLNALSQIPDYVPTDGLVAWYPFDQNFQDESDFGNDAVENGSVPFTDDRFQNGESALSFSGNGNNFLRVNYSSDSYTFESGFSASVWFISNTTSGNRRVFSMGSTDASGKGFHVMKYSNEIGAWFCEGPGDPYFGNWDGNENTTFDIGEWNHLLFSCDFGNLNWTVFLNGDSVNGGTSGFDFDPNQLPVIFTQTFEIGRKSGTSNSGDAWNGVIDDLGIWSRPLTALEAEDLYISLNGIGGCTDSTACNYDASANWNDGTCVPSGCMDAQACNFNPEANCDDGSCDYCECVSPVVFGGNWNDVLISFGTNQLFTTWEDLDLSPIQGRGIRKIVGGEGYFLTLMEDSTVVTLCENCLYGNPPPSTWKVKDVEAGRHEGVLVRADGSLYSFGANYAGLSSEPTVNNAVQCAAASWFHMALLEDGDIVGWGDGWEPCPLELENVIKIDASGNHAVALLESGKLVEWGKLDDGTIATSKDWILELNNVIDAIAGQSSTWIIFNDGSATRVSFPDGEIMMELPASSMTISGTGNWFSVSGHMNANGNVFVQKGGTQIDTTLDLSVYASCDVCIADTDGDGVCNDEELFGCTDEMGCNYIPGATQNANCIYPLLNAQDCMDGAGACGEGTHWDVATQTCVVTNPSDSNFDGCVQLSDLLDLLGAYGTCEWQCGDPMSYQGYDYETVLIGDQCWFAENARYMPFVGGGYQSETPSISVYDYSGNSISEAKSTDNYTSFGALYNFIAVEEVAICPTGWHVPTKEEFDMLFEELGGLDVAHLSMMDIENWNLDFVSTDLGFNVLPAGWLYNSFQSLEEAAFIWTSSTYGENDPRRFEWNIQSENNFIITFEGASQAAGKSVRCLKDAE